jgi:AcrR family transcriptional regulator
MSTARTPPPPAPPRGRPRSSAADAAILDATRELLASEGWAGLTVEGVAARAGVAKTTVYRRFASRTELAVAGVAQLVDAAMVPVDPECAPEEQIRRSIRAVAEVYRIPAARAAYLAVLAEAGRDPELRAAVDAQVLGPARAMVVERLATGVERGEIDPAMAGMQADLLFDVLAGTLVHRMLVRGQDIDDEFVESLVCAIVGALGIGDAQGQTKAASR